MDDDGALLPDRRLLRSTCLLASLRTDLLDERLTMNWLTLHRATPRQPDPSSLINISSVRNLGFRSITSTCPVPQFGPLEPWRQNTGFPPNWTLDPCNWQLMIGNDDGDSERTRLKCQLSATDACIFQTRPEWGYQTSMWRRRRRVECRNRKMTNTFQAPIFASKSPALLFTFLIDFSTSIFAFLARAAPTALSPPRVSSRSTTRQCFKCAPF